MEGKLVCYLKWINMYSSAGSNQGHNRFSLQNKFTLGILEMMTLFLQLDPPECILLSPCGRVLIVCATLSRGQISTGGLQVGACRLILYTRSCLWLLMSLRDWNQACHIFENEARWLFPDILDINITGILYIPPQYRCLFSWTPSKVLVGSLTWDVQVPTSFFWSPCWAEGIACDPL